MFWGLVGMCGVMSTHVGQLGGKVRSARSPPGKDALALWDDNGNGVVCE